MALPNALMKLLACLCLACGPALISQTILTSSHGTLVVILVDNDKIVAGADSLELGEHSVPTDKRCKISRLDDETFFAAARDTSLAGHKTTGETISIFDAHQVAGEALGKFKNEKTSVRTRQMADYWNQAIRNRINNASRLNPGNAPPIRHIEGVFVNNSGKGWYIYFIFINIFLPHTKGTLPTIKSNVKLWTPNATQNVGFLGAGGEYAAEFFANKTARAIAEQKRVEGIIKMTPSIDKSAFIVESAIAAAEKWAPPEDGIGGDTDILELPQGGPIRWLKVKNVCKN